MFVSRVEMYHLDRNVMRYISLLYRQLDAFIIYVLLQAGTGVSGDHFLLSNGLLDDWLHRKVRLVNCPLRGFSVIVLVGPMAV